MKELNLSYNSPGREAALAGMLQMHPTLRSVGIVEKEPTTRSERTWWLDTRAKEMIGRALLSSPTPKLEYLQCDLFSLTESVETLAWKSKAPCDAIVLAGVLRCNSVLKTLNLLGSDGEIGDYEREEIGMALISNKSGKVGYSDMYGLKEGMSPTFSVDLKDKDQIRSKRAFVLFAGLLRANSTLTRLSLSSVIPEHIDVLADALATNTTLKTLVLEQPSKSAPTAYATLPVQQLNGHDGLETIDMFDAGGDQPVHKHACAVVGAILGAQMGANTSIRALRINPGGGSEGGLILDHLHRARRSSLVVLDLANIGSVKVFARECQARHPRSISTLISVAAEIVYEHPRLTASGADLGFATNHLGLQALVSELEPSLMQASPAGSERKRVGMPRPALNRTLAPVGCACGRRSRTARAVLAGTA